MTEEEYRRKMKENGWDDKTIDRDLKRFHEDQKKGHALPLEFWIIVPKPTIIERRPDSEYE